MEIGDDNSMLCIPNGDSDSNDSSDEITKNQKLRTDLKHWALRYNTPHLAGKDLLTIINNRFSGNNINILPDDPRTLLRTPESVSLIPLIDGEYWHHGLENCLKKAFPNINPPNIMSLNFNIDGLPIYNSSKMELWPILFNITEMPQVPPMVIGVFCGKAKTSDVNSFLTPFVDELKEIIMNGVEINSHKITIKVRCFVCDSPARAIVKGVANFNGQHGCLKCTTIGEYSHESNTNIFPRSGCERRTDENFRAKLYVGHHKIDSAILKLDIDIVEQFPVGDSLHLLHLGVMKRLLFGWRDGTFRNSGTKWRRETILDVSKYLTECRIPAEFQRVVRSLDCLSHWKGTEYRTFMHYIGNVVLKDHLEERVYKHFLLLFCGVTICACKRYFNLLPLARELLARYIEIYKEIYGEQYLTSNVHNLSHLVDEVEQYGELETFRAYPFENALGKMKRIIRSGNRPLAQIAKRILEGLLLKNINQFSDVVKDDESVIVLSKRNLGENVPESLKTSEEEITFYSKVQLSAFCLSTDNVNCWFLTSKNEITCIKNIIFRGSNDVKLYCVFIQGQRNFFELPIESHFLDIYCTPRDSHFNNIGSAAKVLNFSDIKCKLVRLKYNDIDVFLPLLHTKLTA